MLLRIDHHSKLQDNKAIVSCKNVKKSTSSKWTYRLFGHNHRIATLTVSGITIPSLNR